MIDNIVHEGTFCADTGIWLKDCVLYEFQSKIVYQLLENENYGISIQKLSERMGSGKTIMCLALISNSFMPAISHPVLPYHDHKLDESPPEIPINLILCNRAMIGHWERHLDKMTKFRYISCTNGRTLAKLTAENIGFYDIILISNSTIKCDITDIAHNELDILSVHHTKSGYRLIDAFLLKFGMPTFARVIIDDYSEFSALNKMKVPIGRSNIYVSSTGSLRVDNMPEYSIYNNLYSYMYYNLYIYQNNLARVRTDMCYRTQLDDIPALRILEHYNSMPAMPFIKSIIHKEPELAEEISISTINPNCSIIDILNLILMGPEIRIKELDPESDKYEISVLRHKIKTRKELIFANECPLCFDDISGSSFYHMCCHCTICEDCRAGEIESGRTICPQCGKQSPIILNINKDKITGNIDELDNKGFINELVHSIKSGTVMGNEIEPKWLGCSGLSFGDYYIEPPNNDHIIGIIVSNQLAEQYAREQLSEFDVYKLSWQNVYELSQLEPASGSPIILINTSDVAHGIELPNLTDLIISHEFNDAHKLSQAIGRVQRLTREYSCIIHKITNIF